MYSFEREKENYKCRRYYAFKYYQKMEICYILTNLDGIVRGTVHNKNLTLVFS